MRYLFLFLVVIVLTFLFLQERIMQRESVKPIFLRVDEIANGHQTVIKTDVKSVYKPSAIQLQNLVTDYANLWAHLNHLYATNDVNAGKEYYTEDWFKQICRSYKNSLEPSVEREDVLHELNIINWSSDALVCNAIDSNVIFKYHYPDQTEITTVADIAIVLLYQGDHWRIDAIRILNEKTINNYNQTN